MPGWSNGKTRDCKSLDDGPIPSLGFMIILPYVKVGTVPFGCARVKNKRKLPKEGDTIFIRENRDDKDKYSNPWIEVKVETSNVDCWFVSKI